MNAGTSGSAPLGGGGRLSMSDAVLYYGMRLLPWFGVRRAIAKTVATCIGSGRATQPKPVEHGVDSSAIYDSLCRAGWSSLPRLLGDQQLAEVLSYLKAKELVGADGTRFTFDAPSGSTAMGSYPIATVLECPHILDLMNRPDILAVAQAYLGCRPTISGLRIDWSCPTQGAPDDVQQFHRDYDDWKFLKLFVYLTDVDDESGPHEFIATSHTGSGRLRARPYEPVEIEREYGRHNMTRVRGACGTCFMVDTWGIHKGHVPRSRWRMMLQIQYSMLPVLKFNYSPVNMHIPLSFDKHANRLLIA